MIPFHRPFVCGKEELLMADAVRRGQFSGGGYYTQACERWLERFTGARKVLLTSSCTHALEMCALLCDIQPGDEVIMSSYNFVSAANAFVLRGASIRFIDVVPGTMNLDEELLAQAITERTKVILVMHYGGVSCQIKEIISLARQRGIWVIEDAAHCIGAYYQGDHLGTIGHLGTLSFHSTKNIQCGEGGALLINEERLIKSAEIIREKGTNRSAFMQGKIGYYTWVALGSSYLMSEVNAAFLFAQLEHVEQVNKKRRYLWHLYQKELQQLESLSLACGPIDPTASNGHIFFCKTEHPQQRDSVIQQLKVKGITTPFHYIPLHGTEPGQQFGSFVGMDRFCTRGSQSLFRLPLYFDLGEEDVMNICQTLRKIVTRL